MANQRIRQGDAGRTVAANIHSLRCGRYWTLARMSRGFAAGGRNIDADGVRRIETGRRRVDVDDLVIAAALFGVSVGDLLEDYPDGGTQPTAADVDAYYATPDAAEAGVPAAARHFGITLGQAVQILDIARCRAANARLRTSR